MKEASVGSAVSIEGLFFLAVVLLDSLAAPVVGGWGGVGVRSVKWPAAPAPRTPSVCR